MKITVNPDRSVKKEYGENEINDGSQNENRVTTISFEVPEDYSDFTKRIVFITKDGNYFDEIANDEYVLKNNITKYKKLAAFVWLINTTTHQDFRSEVFPLEFNYNENFSDSVPSEQEMSQIEILFEQLEDLIEEVESIENLTYEIVEELPTENIDPHVIYLVLREDSEPNNIYDEWMYINEEWELIGTTAIDLQPLQKEIDEINEMLFTHTTVQSENSEATLNGNSNLEMNITELDGKIEQDGTQGYNLIDINSGEIVTVTFGVDRSINGNEITLNGSRNDGETSIGRIIIDNITEFNSLVSGRTYKLTLNDTSGTYTGKIGLAFLGGSPLHQLDFIETNSFSVTKTLNFSDEVTKIWLIFNGNFSATNFKFKLMLQEGTSTYDWEQYTGGQASPNPDYPQNIDVVTGNQDVVVSGKNIAYDSRYTSQTGKYGGVGICSYTLEEGKQYTISFDTDNSGLQVYRQSPAISGFNNASAYNFTCDGTRKSFTATGTSGTYTNISVVLRLSDTSDTPCSISNLMISELEDTTYKPYHTPITKQVHLGEIELAKIGNYKDYIWTDRSTGKWYVHKIVEKTPLANKVVARLNTVTSGEYRFTFSLNNAYRSTDPTEVCRNYCNVAKGGTREDTNVQSFDCITYGIDGNDYYLDGVIYLNDTKTMTVEQFNAYASQKNIVLYYQLATPTDTEITDETLLADLNSIQKLQQLNGTTIVSIEGDLAADFKLVYENDSISDLNTRVGNIEANYVKNTDYASNSKGGVIKVGAYSVYIGSDGNIRCNGRTYAEYQNISNVDFISKGTLENVLNAKIGDINTMLDQMNREVV